MNCLTSLCRYTASRRPDVLGAMPGFFLRHTTPAVCRPPAIAQATPHLWQHPIQIQSRAVIGRPPAPTSRQVLLPTRHDRTFQPEPVTRRWYYNNPRKVAVAAAPLIGGIYGATIADYDGYLETVPCTHRTHFLLCSPLEERQHSDSRVAHVRDKHASIILDPRHPTSVRLNSITSKLVRAVHSHLVTTKSHDSTTVCRGNAGSAMETLRSKLLGNAWRAQPATRHLNGLDWEVIVVEDERVNLWSYPAGKIVATTGLLQVFKTDAEVATMIAHEIGHWAEKIIYRKCLPRPLRVPFFRRVEREADQIGMMILVAAGFDPRLAPLAFEKLGHNRRFLSTYPSSKKRSQLLSRNKIMEKALKLYREASPDQHT